MANVFTGAVGEGGHAASLRGMEELLRSCVASSCGESAISPSAPIMPETCWPLSQDGGGTQGSEAPLKHQQNFSEPGEQGVALKLDESAGTHVERVPSSIASRLSSCSEGSQSEARDGLKQNDGNEPGLWQSEKCASAVSSWRNSAPELRTDAIISGSCSKVSSNWFPLVEPTTSSVGRAATTTSASVLTNDENRQDEAGRGFRGGAENYFSSDFPFLPATSINPLYGTLENGEALLGDLGTAQATKPAGGSLGGSTTITVEPPPDASGTQSTSQTNGTWSIGSSLPTCPGNTNELLNWVVPSIKMDSSASLPVGAPNWGGDRRGLFDPGVALSDLARRGGRSDGSSFETRSADDNDAYNQLLGTASMPAALSAWQLLEAAATTPLLGMAGCDSRIRGCGPQISGFDDSQFLLPPVREEGVFDQGGLAGENLPHLSGLQGSAALQQNLSQSQLLSLLSQVNAHQSQELLNYKKLLNVLRGSDVGNLARNSQSLQGMPPFPNAARVGDAQDPLLASLSQPREFRLFHRDVRTGIDCGALLSAPGNLGTTCVAHMIGEHGVKRGHRNAALLETEVPRKKIKKMKGNQDVTTDSCPGSPKQASRKKREVSRKALESPGGASVTTSRARIMTELVNFTEGDVAELEAEAFNRQSNRSRNTPPETVSAVDFTGESITFSKVIGLHYHPKQNRWLAWRSQKGSKKVFKSFSTKKFGVSGARLMALRWRLGYGLTEEENQGLSSDCNDTDEEIQQALSGDERVQLPLDAALGCDELSDSTATGGWGSSESSTPSNVREQVCDISRHSSVRGLDAVKESFGAALGEKQAQSPVAAPLCAPSSPWKEETASVQQQLPVEGAAAREGNSSPVARDSDPNKESKSDALDSPAAPMSDRLKLLLGSVIPAEDFINPLTTRMEGEGPVFSLQGSAEEMEVARVQRSEEGVVGCSEGEA